jgi:peptidoglycan-associated lipoprotein
MPNRNLSLIALLVLALVLLPLGCKKKPPETVPDEPEPTAATEQPPADAAETEPHVEITEGFQQERPDVQDVVEKSAAEWNAMSVLETVYFDFDKSDLSDATRAALRANAEWLRGHSSYGVVIEGHCDERGTIEYNLALGQRRAQTVRDYLTSLGVQGARMRTKSYGEERPVDPGHTEEGWARNRRAEFVIE